MIVRVFGDGAPTEVPVTPETTTSDVIECCRDPGDESCDLIAVCPEHGDRFFVCDREEKLQVKK
ncbi:hypothetical protein NQ315_002192 [Exocentrus adspersus]|uniref:Ras association domain-containing protein n=1 Tax=Exocentrus adspersus TaxID=1586481 RepID=A0AAV8VZ85_9CUCU|nr:hypothetical protein NQ315_002192 [Exocentrus adspersus]